MQQSTGRELRRRARVTQFVYDALICGVLSWGAQERWWPTWLASVLVLVTIAGGVVAYAWATKPTWKLSERAPRG